MPYRFYFKVFAVDAVIMFVVMLIYLFSKSADTVWVLSQAFLSGVFFGLVMTMLAAGHVFIVDKAEKEDRLPPLAGEGKYSPFLFRKFSFAASAGRLFEICGDFASEREYKVNEKDESNFRLSLSTPMTFVSWGHSAELSVGREEGGSSLEIKIRPKLPVTLFDFGKSYNLAADIYNYARKRAV